MDVFARDAPTSSGAAAAAGSAAPASAADATGSGAAKLSELFRPPEGLAFPGDWDAAVAAAARDGRWLLLNVQSADEFASHQLNRDTWGQPLVQDMLRGSFVFWQVCPACFAAPPWLSCGERAVCASPPGVPGTRYVHLKFKNNMLMYRT